MKKIPLRNKEKEIIHYVLVDDDNYEWLSQWTWCYSGGGYAASKSPAKFGKARRIYMHRIIMGVTDPLTGKNLAPNIQIDHIDENKLNNQQTNLRRCTNSENHCNVGISIKSTTGVKGLTRTKDKRRNLSGYWQGNIRHKGKRYTKSNKHRHVIEAWLIKKREELHKEFAKHK